MNAMPSQKPASMDRQHWSRRISQLDPARDYHEIYRILAAHEFPWDINQSLSFALYRTYAVPSIGRLLFETGEFAQRTQSATTTPRSSSTPSWNTEWPARSAGPQCGA